MGAIALTAAQRRAALLRVSLAEGMRGPQFRRLSREEIANYYGDGQTIPRDAWAILESEGLIAFGPMRLTDAGRATLAASKDGAK